MKKFTTIFCLSVLIAVFLFMFVFTVCFRTEKSDIDDLKDWPEFTLESFLSGEYLREFVSCFTNTIMYRDKFIETEGRLSALYGIQDNDEPIENEIYEEADPTVEDDELNDIISSSESYDISDESNSTEPDESEIVSSVPESSVSEDSQPEVSDPEVSEPEESSDIDNTPSEPVGDANPEMSGSILIIGTRALEIYRGNVAGAERYALLLNKFAEQLDESVNVYSMVIPKASAYYIEQAGEKYEKYIYRNKDDITKISETLSNRVIDVNIYNILGRHAGEDIYFRTDTHWSALGAYYGTSVFADKAGIAFPALSEYTETHRDGYVGVMYKYSDKNDRLLNNPENFVVYYPKTDYDVYYYSKDSFDGDPLNLNNNYDGFFWEISDDSRSSWYSTFLRGDTYAVKAVSNDCKNGRKLLIVKDSYGNALAPFLIEGFEEIYIVDARAYKDSLSETVENLGITDLLFAECTFSAVGKDYYNCLEELCK